jgi:hypothetical protein
MVLRDSRQQELIGMMEVAVSESSRDELAVKLGVTPKTVSNAIRDGKVTTRKHQLYVEKLDQMLGNASCIPADIARKLTELRLAWFSPNNHRLLPRWVQENGQLLEDACSGVEARSETQLERFVGYSLVLGVSYLYQGILAARNRAESAATNKNALRHLQNAHEFGKQRLSPYLADRLVMQISCAIFNSSEQEIVSDPERRASISKQLQELRSTTVCHRIANAVRRDYAPLWNGVLFAVTTRDFEMAANFYSQLEQYCPNGNDPVTGHPLLKSIWNEHIVAHERTKLEDALKLRLAAESAQRLGKSDKTKARQRRHP